METTTIEDAVSLITEPAEAPEETTEEVVEEAEIVEAAETEEPTQEVESFDDDVDLDDVELDDLAEPDAPETDNLIPVKVNGKDEMWTLDQLKQSAAGQGYINQRMQELAQQKKQQDALAQQLAQERQQALQVIQQAQQGGLQPPVPPTKDMFETDPIGYMEAKLHYDEAKATYDQQMLQVHRMQQQQQSAQLQQRQNYLSQQAEMLKQRIPEIADPQKGDVLKKDLIATGVHYGFSENEIANVADARYVSALYDAMKYRRLVEKRAATAKKDDKPVVKAGAKRRVSEGEQASKRKQQSKLRKSGKIEDALDLMLKS